MSTKADRPGRIGNMGNARDPQIADPMGNRCDPQIAIELLQVAADIGDRGGLVLTPDQIDLLQVLIQVAAEIGAHQVTWQIEHQIALSDGYAGMAGATYPEDEATYGRPTAPLKLSKPQR